MSDDRKKQQWKVIGLLGGGGVVALFIVGQLMGGTGAARGLSGPAGVSETVIDDRTSAATPEMSWVTQSREQIAGLSKLVEELNRTVGAQQSEKEAMLATLEQLQADSDEAMIMQQAEINALKEQIAGSGGARPGTLGAPATHGIAPGGDGAGGDFIRTSGIRTPVSGQPRSGPGGAPSQPVSMPFGSGFATDFTLTPKPVAPIDERVSGSIKSLKSYIPAGSYAPAVIISGVDASTGVVSRDRPIPVLMRLTGPATTAAAGTLAGRTVNVTGCTVLGSAIGDLSSERVYVRLTTMTCIGSGDQVLETKVAGLVAGSGKAGVRGRVVSREGDLVKNATIAGVLGGIASTFESATSISAENTENPDAASVLKTAGIGAASGGASGAAQTLADYYIARAEQYQPVVSLYAGTDVEVVFMEGVELK